jgi:hypothetical protein
MKSLILRTNKIEKKIIIYFKLNMTTNNYILGFGVSNEQFRQFVEPLPAGRSDTKTLDINDNEKYQGYFDENLYYIPTPSTLYQFIEAVFDIDYAYSLRREYRRENDLPEYAKCSDPEDKYVEEKFKDYKNTRPIPEVFKHLSIGFINTYGSDTINRFAFGLNIENLSDYSEKAKQFKEYYDCIGDFFNLEEEYTCPSIYKVN